MNSIRKFLRGLAIEEDGAQVVEYALIIAVVSIALVIALSAIAGGANNPFATFIARVTTCLTNTTPGSCK
ncbi:pilus assembly protein Flp/PilA [Variovorax sp. HW608]|uniref:Flp family type IVb pilin n=1 Tax=Variovorax sp. HW608 TaxID=1034889 RepID=UPI00081FAA6E|nr:Flp family type IVb pilin [Variovorax sp. HW608]SCK30747.1 pilus assembly protein Flp/PilA [Variovorax sp. HW608]